MGASVSYLVVQVALSRFASLVASWNELAMVESSYQMQRPIQECVLLPAAPRASGATWPGWRRWAAPPATPARARPKPASSSRPCRRQIRWAEKNRVREMTEPIFCILLMKSFVFFLISFRMEDTFNVSSIWLLSIICCLMVDNDCLVWKVGASLCNYFAFFKWLGTRTGAWVWWLLRQHHQVEPPPLLSS